MSEEAASSSGSMSWSEADGQSQQNGSGLHSPMSGTTKLAKRVKPKPLKEVLAKVLPILQRRDLYQFFALPVPAAEVPEYYSVIQRPMDFSTMERKFNQGEYDSVDAFRNDFLLITENAQYFNGVDGPSGIIHTEAKKLQEWGLRLINKEGAAVMEERIEEEKPAPLLLKKPAASNGKFNIRLKKFASPHTSATTTPRVSTPSRLNQEIKMEEDDEGEGDYDSEEDFDASSMMGSSSGGEASASLDGFGTPGTRDSPDTVRKYTKRATGPRAPYTHKKNRPRLSAVVGLLSNSVTNDEEGEGRPTMAPVSSTSGAVAAAVPLVYGPDGSIDLGRLTEDERRAILRPAGLDDWPDLLPPYLESILPLHTDIQPNAQTLARPLKVMLDGLGSAILSNPTGISSSFSYDVENLSSDQQKSPFAISSGHEFESQGGEASIPLAWPRSTNLPSSSTGPLPPLSTGEVANTAPLRQLKGRDREREREVAAAGNLDDWTFSRAHLAKLMEPLDLGLYPGLLPAAWINHIRSSKGGPAKSRLPPYHLSQGQTFEKALQDELTSLPYRALLDGKPGVVGSSAAIVEPNSDICTSLAQGVEQNWTRTEEETRKAGVRGSDVIREAVFGGALGEAYSSSVFKFVSGAARSVAMPKDDDDAEIEAGRDNDDAKPSLKLISSPVKVEPSRIVPSYFDDDGEMLDQEGYLGMGLIPLEVRKEAGLSSQPKRSRSYQTSPLPSPLDTRRSSRDPSVAFAKRQRMYSTPIEEEAHDKMEDGDEPKERKIRSDDHLNNLTSAYLSGAVLGPTLEEYVRDDVILPLTGGMLDILVRAGKEVEGSNDQSKEDDDETDWRAIFGNEWDALANQLPVMDKISTPLSAFTEKTTRDEMVGKLAKKMLSGEYNRAWWQMAELKRAKQGVIELDSLVRSKEEMLNEAQQMKDSHPLRWSSMEMNSEKVTKALEQYAQILQTLSTSRDEGSGQLNDEILDHLRLAFIALAKLVPTKDLARGQWAAWAEYLQQQMAHQKQYQASK